jgi:hypothetical protein
VGNVSGFNVWLIVVFRLIQRFYRFTQKKLGVKKFAPKPRQKLVIHNPFSFLALLVKALTGMTATISPKLTRLQFSASIALF